MANVRTDIKRSAALEALQTESTFTAAAEKAGISRRTLYDYLYNDKEFAFAYREQLRLRSLVRAEQATNEREAALQTIREIMQDDEQPAAVRLKAAEKLLDYADSGCATEFKRAGDAVDKHTGWAFE
jgi:molybdenum-dependent DNA-binding transcriptional regulator ModE